MSVSKVVTLPVAATEKRNGIEIIRESFSILSANSSHVGEVFYHRLAETAPDIVAVFGSYFDGGGSKFQVVSEVVNRHLRSLLFMPVTADGQKPPVPPAVLQLGHRHAQFPISAAQFARMKDALLWTLEQTLGPAFTPEVRDAWSVAYDNLSDMLQRGIERARSAPHPDAAPAAPPPAPEVLRRMDAAAGDHGREDPIARFFQRTEAV